jgi:NAD(P)-dependent dehydrogenase (short-subunit alcohol dehydrogenase family)
MHVKGKVAVVTGGASGIGLGLCTRFAREGAQVVLSDLSQESCEREAASSVNETSIDWSWS